MAWLQSWGALVIACLAMFVACRAWVYAVRAATAETNRRSAGRIAGERGLPGIAYLTDSVGVVHCHQVRPGEPIPDGYRYTPAIKERRP